MEQEGIIFRTNAHVGVNISAKHLKEEFDAIVDVWWCFGTPRPSNSWKTILRVFTLPWTFLTQQNKRVAGDRIFSGEILGER